MKKYKFTKREQDILKVAKYNQKLADDLLDEYKAAHIQNSIDIDDNERYLQEIESKLNITPQKDFAIQRKKAQQNPLISDWDQLVNEASDAIPYDVGFEDILSWEEIKNAYAHLDEINDTFAKKTKFKKIDWLFLVTAIALQCTRQYVIDPWIKRQRPGAGSNDEKGRKGNAEPGWYYVATENILINKVPFDAAIYGTSGSIQGFLKGADHRKMTLGHDPLLGWVFGTANILTSTLTRADLISAHIKYQQGKGNVIHSLANTGKVFTSVKGRLFEEGFDGKIAFGSAVVREAIHLKSDVGTKKSLPIPVISSVSIDFSNKLSQYGIDIASVGTEIGLSVFINSLISMVHRLFYDESIDDAKLYEVRTRKILLYSNAIASTSNIIAAVITKSLKILDVGGLLVTIIRLFSDIRFIARIKQEFIQSTLDVHFEGIVKEMEEMYATI